MLRFFYMKIKSETNETKETWYDSGTQVQVASVVASVGVTPRNSW